MRTRVEVERIQIIQRWRRSADHTRLSCRLGDGASGGHQEQHDERQHGCRASGQVILLLPNRELAPDCGRVQLIPNPNDVETCAVDEVARFAEDDLARK